MKNSRLVGRFLRSTMLTGVAAAMAAPAFAQGDDTIIVTGSRLNQANLNSASPVFQVDASEVDTRGATRVEDLLNILPQAFAGQTSDVANGASGTSTLNLRGLGSLRTLVLIDGKRLPYGGPRISSANLDLIPAQLVERVDIVTGGASAVYGSDALAGVANFIMRRDFEGIEFDGQVGFYQDGNGDEFHEAVLAANGIAAPGGGLDGRDVLASITFGANTADGRGNVTAFFSYQDQNEIRQDARDYSTCAHTGAGPGPTTIGGIGCVGSSTFRRFFTPGFTPQTMVAGVGTEGDALPAGAVVNGPSDGGDLFLNEDGGFVPFTGAGSQTFNFAPDNFIQRPIERFNFAAFARYELTDNIEAYMDFGYTTNRTDAQIAFSGSFFRPFSVNCANPFLDGILTTGQTLADSLGCNTPAQTPVLSAMDVDMNGMLDDQVLFDDDGDPLTAPVPVFTEGATPTSVPLTFGYRNVTGDPRNTFNDFATFRIVGGFRGTIGDNWNWDAFGQFSRTTNVSISSGDLNFANLQDALNVVDNGSGPVCASGNANCIPFNVFQRGADGSSLVSLSAAQSAQGAGFRNGNTEQKIIGATIAGDLGEYGFQFPWAENSIQLLVGAEWREDQLVSQPDDVSQIPGGRGFTGVGGGTLPVAGEVSLWELFMETQIPLIEGKTFFEEFGINGAYRYSNYETDGNGVQNSFDTHTFSAGISWVPVDDVRLRGQFQRAVRAPNVIELFTGQNTGLFNASATNGIFDPCATATPNATAAQCAFTGVSGAQFGSIPDNPAGQLNAVTGGNPLLNPEKSDTYTFGIVYTPSWLPGFNFAADYFDITINDAIATVPPQTALNQCIASGDPAFCGLITRDGFGSLFLSNFLPSGALAGVFGTNTNISNLATRGLDISAGYGLDLADMGLGNMGSLNLGYVSTTLFELSSIPVPGVTTTTECKGLYRGSCGGPNPTYRHRLLTTWQSPWNIDVTATWRYYGEVTLDTGQSTGGVFTPTGNVADDTLDAANYLDLAAQWYVRENVTLRAGVQNVFGRDPEFTTAAGTAPGNGDTFPGTYDPAGRYIFFGVNISM